jgi:hypothetical protein
MKIEYIYKDKVFDDIRDIVYNNKLRIDFKYILEEYLPFQTFITGRTFFKDLTINSSIKFDPFEYVKYKRFNRELFSKSIEDYLYEYEFDSSKEFAAAVSGGVDSSVVALETNPKIIYSGFYEGKNFDETPYSKLIAEKINATHYTYKLNEIDFLRNIEECLEIICTPIAGLGSVMEYATLKKLLIDEPGVNQVLFGNGGDEIFMGYFYNYYIKEFYDNSFREPKYMPNFLKSKKEIAKEIIDFTIIASFNRGPLSVLYSPFVVRKFIPMLNKIVSMVDKLLYVNINISLPSLLHLNNQFCRSLGVKSFNPLSNSMLIKLARHINTPMTEYPKEVLRNIHMNIPKPIKNNYIKRGFPVPVDEWNNLYVMIKNTYDCFFNRPEIVIEKIPFNGINRYSWGVFQSELCLRRFAK